MANLSLPPRISGSPKGNLEVRIDLLRTTIENEKRVKPKFVRIKWWGQSEDEAVIVPLSGPNASLVTNYKIVSQKERFRDYLKDANRIFMETVAANGQTLGFAVIDRLERIVDFGGITLDDLEVFNQDHEIVAVLRCIFIYDETKSHGKVTFQDIPHHVTISSDDEEDPDYDEVVSEMLSQNENNEKQVRDILERSRKKVMSNLPEKLPPQVSNSANGVQKSLYNQKSLSETAKPELELPQRQKDLPTWNLSTDRLKFMSQVDNMSIKVRKIELHPKVVAQLPTFNSSQPRRQKPSFILKYSLPHEKDDVTVCASKTKDLKSKRHLMDHTLQFDSMTDHPLRFTTGLLDSWWVSSVKMSLFVRYLGQRLPLNLGEASLGLKHLLMNSKYSSGAEMKLPIYGSTSFRRHLEPQIKEEIIGDVFVTFNFSVPKKESAPTSTAANAAVTSSSSRKVVLESVPSTSRGTNQKLSGTKLNEDVISTVWKFHDFSIIQILHEINFWGF